MSKVKCVGVYVMKAYGGLKLSFYCFLTSDLDRSGQLHAPAALPPEKESSLSVEQEAGWASETVRSKIKALAPTGNRTIIPRSSSA